MDRESAICVAIAEDHTSVRMGITSLLEATGKIKVVLEASNGVEMIARLRRQAPFQR